MHLARKKRNIIYMLTALAVFLLVGNLIGRQFTHAEVEPPSTLVTNCSKDVTADLQKVIDRAPDGTPGKPTVINLGSNVCYGLGSRASGNLGTQKNLGSRNGLIISNRKHLTIKGESTQKPRLKAMFDAPTGADGYRINRASLWLDNSSDITIENISLIGTNSKGGYVANSGAEHDHNIKIVGGSNITIKGVEASNAYGDNVYIGAGPNNSGSGRMPWGPRGEGATVSNDVTIKNSTLSQSGRHNIGIVAGRNITIADNVMKKSGYWSIDLEQQLKQTPIENVTIQNNKADGSHFGFAVVNVQGDTATGVRNITIDKNTYKNSETCQEFVSINANSRPTSNPGPTTNVSVTNNTLYNNQYGVSASYMDGLTVKGNRGYTRSAMKLCSAGDSTSGSPKLFSLVAAGEKLKNVTVQNNSYLVSSGDTAQTASFVQKVGVVNASSNVKDCSNNTTRSTQGKFDQPYTCKNENGTKPDTKKPPVRPPVIPEPQKPPVTTKPPVTPPTTNQPNTSGLSITQPADGQVIQIPSGNRTLVTISGTATPQASVRVTVIGITQRVTASVNGKWSVRYTLSPGTFEASATQVVSGVTSEPVSRMFSVQK